MSTSLLAGVVHDALGEVLGFRHRLHTALACGVDELSIVVGGRGRGTVGAAADLPDEDSLHDLGAAGRQGQAGAGAGRTADGVGGSGVQLQQQFRHLLAPVMLLRKFAGDKDVRLPAVAAVVQDYPAFRGQQGGNGAQAVGIISSAGRKYHRGARPGAVVFVVQVDSVDVGVGHSLPPVSDLAQTVSRRRRACQSVRGGRSPTWACGARWDGPRAGRSDNRRASG